MSDEKLSVLSEIIHGRRSVRVYDQDRKIPNQLVKEALQLAQLAPNSSNLQVWEAYHVSSQQVKEHLAKACLGQRAASTASALVVFVVRPDRWQKHARLNLQHLNSMEGDERSKKIAENYYGKIIPFLYRQDFLGLATLLRKVTSLFLSMKGPSFRQVTATDRRIVAHKSCALAAENFMLAMKAAGADTCPMEGFDSRMVKAILKLPREAEVNMVVSCGYGTKEGIYGERFRLPFSDFYHHLS